MSSGLILGARKFRIFPNWISQILGFISETSS
jgi:hypothetical protein